MLPAGRLNHSPYEVEGLSVLPRIKKSPEFAAEDLDAGPRAMTLEAEEYLSVDTAAAD